MSAVNRQPATRVEDPLEFDWERVLLPAKTPRANGLQKLTPLHRQIITYYSRGTSYREIAAILGITEQEVAIVIRDPLAQKELEVLFEGYKQELTALQPLAVEAVRSGLTNSDARIKLLAADKFFKATGQYGGENAKPAQSAEDVVKEALARIAVSQNNELREINAESRRADSMAKIIDVKANDPGDE